MARVGFGRTNPFPFKFGGGICQSITEMERIQDALRDGFDANDDSLASCYAYAEGRMLGIVWAINNRTKNSALATKTIDWLESFEEILEIVPDPNSNNRARRAVVAGRLNAFGVSNLSDLQALSALILGPHYVSAGTVEPADYVVYWPPNPGPPGYEWMTNKLVLFVRVTRAGGTESQFRARIASWEQTMQRILPSYCSYDWYEGDGFYLGSSTLGVDAYG